MTAWVHAHWWPLFAVCCVALAGAVCALGWRWRDYRRDGRRRPGVSVPETSFDCRFDRCSGCDGGGCRCGCHDPSGAAWAAELHAMPSPLRESERIAWPDDPAAIWRWLGCDTGTGDQTGYSPLADPQWIPLDLLWRASEAVAA